MGNYENLKQSITEVIRTNGNQEITGSVLQSTLLTIISTVGANATFAGIATPATNPGTPDGPEFYLASESGTYTNFNAIELQDGLSVLIWNGSWSSQQIFGIDNEPIAGSDNLVKSGGVYAKIKALEDAGYVFAGIATPATNPGTPDGPVFYIASTVGNYPNFGLSLGFGESAVFKNSNGVWTKNSLGLISSQKQNEYNNTRPTLTLSNYNSTNPSIIIDTINKKLKVEGRIIITDAGSIIVDREEGNYETDFVGDLVDASRVAYLVFNIQDAKLYYVDFQGISEYPEYNSATGERNNIRLGSIIKQTNGIWSFGFNFGYIQIDGVDYYGNVRKDNSYVDLRTNIRPSMCVYSYYTKLPTLYIDTINKKLKVEGRIIITDAGSIIVDREGENYETDFVGDLANPIRVAYLVYNVQDAKLYYVDFQGISEYPEYSTDGKQRINIYIGSLIRQSTGVWGFGFNFAHIQIDGVDYYGSPNSFIPLSKDNAAFINSQRTENLFDKSAVVNGYYGDDGVTFKESGQYWCSDYIAVEPGQAYKRNKDESFYIYCYDENKDIVQIEGKSYWQPGAQFVIPESVYYVRQVIAPESIDGAMFALSSVSFANYIPYKRYILSSEIEVSHEGANSEITEFDISDVGNLQYNEIDDKDYSQLIMYGQSLSMGWEAPEAIAEQPIQGVYMIGDKVAIRHGNNGQNVLTPLVSTTASYCGENPTVGAINAFVPMYRRFMKKDQLFIATSCGEGGKSIEQLSKECTNGTNYYTDEFLNALTRTKAAADAEGKSVGCFAILYMQGEYNYVNLAGAGLTPGTDATNDKNQYKAYLKTLKDNMQADIMEKYGQTQKPLFFIYEVAGSYINRFDMSINMAQVEFAMENDDVFLLPPTYPVPDYGGGHLSTNGYRWYGEMMAKALYKVFVRGERFYPIFPQKYSILGNTIRVDMFVPVLPLVFDTWTKEAITNMGFRVQVNDVDVSINSVDIQDNAVLITCNSELTGKVAITYAGQGRDGSGNLRDSDTWHSYYTYYDDRETSPSKRENYTPLDKPGGQPIYEKPYPMFNWCGNFYKLIQNE